MSSQNQNHHIDLAPEVVRMAQIRANKHGVSFRQELARLIAEETVMSLDHELELMVEGETMNQSDVLAAALGVNDIVVNGHRIDVRVIDEDGEVVAARALIGSQYMSAGSLVVRLRGIEGGEVVAVGGRADRPVLEQVDGLDPLAGRGGGERRLVGAVGIHRPAAIAGDRAADEPTPFGVDRDDLGQSEVGAPADQGVGAGDGLELITHRRPHSRSATPCRRRCGW